MPKRIGYHYSDKLWEIGEVIPGYDNMPGLHPSLHAAEEIIRSAHPNGTAIRSNAVYVWDTEERARKQWAAAGVVKKAKKYLYKVEYEVEERLHKGDLSHYSEALHQRGGVEQAKASAARYWSGEPHPTESPRFEVLVPTATVLEREDFKPAPLKPIDEDSDYPFLNTLPENED
ncbi:hypothetical protein [Mesorhizobium sp. M1B.F.Ca.ET.045.04.1.1]|uniref:hypothetical protein n=1 Tax=Mesorhizobium sp. M1B.F.Ca.ET.045.04.1.1 TaxID=2493673 RepID=UPI000F763392|nr:hypothetical protein [Mesorhizobium sp. M1B.F.Ca.ET.045.04.1.1]AZO29791.1 hypothetical protein EJ071_21910 [Mesorhizobium sp. M1B.F.Ca.ET.045.04.1.1]